MHEPADKRSRSCCKKLWNVEMMHGKQRERFCSAYQIVEEAGLEEEYEEWKESSKKETGQYEA